MKKKKYLGYGIVIVLVLLILIIITYNVLSNKNKLTTEERTWLNNNINNVQNVYVNKDSNIFSKNGKGVYYQFLDDFSNKYGLTLNIIPIDNISSADGVNLNYTKVITEDDTLIYRDHYILISKNKQNINQIKDLQNKIVGVLNSDLNYIQGYLQDTSINFNGYDTEEELFKALNSNVNYIILPRILYIDKILNDNLEIIYHLSDINIYYTIHSNKDILSSILNKYFNKWQDNFDKVMKENEYEIFTKYLNVTDSEKDKLLSINYNYGFINNSPYEVISNGKYGGIVAEYLEEFSSFSGVYFNITKYKNVNKLTKAINNNKVDIYFAYNDNINTNYVKTNNGIISTLSIITNKTNEKIFNSIYGLQGETVYVLENSYLHNYLKDIGNINIKTYNNNKELFKLNNKDNIIVTDTYTYNYYSNNKLNNYVSKYDFKTNNKYVFRINTNYPILSKLFDKYLSYLDNFAIISNGINSHEKIIASGKVLNTISLYIIIGITFILIIGFLSYKKSKKIIIGKRIKKDEKRRFIDELTCLKNRTYLSDFLKTWSNNTIYPQCIIVVDLNHIKDINDKYGLEEGDKQIKALANALIKTQLDNSDLIRSDGNEFVIYTVGYKERQILNYIHKLTKEIKKLPYDYGAEFGFSIIENNLKTVEDALNEAIEDMKKKKSGNK